LKIISQIKPILYNNDVDNANLERASH